MRKRVVITGLGAVTPLGNDVPTLWDSLLAGRSGVGPITQFDATYLKVRIAAEVKNFDPVTLFGRRKARRNDRFTLFALEAARQAIADAGLQFEQGDGREVGVIIGTAIGGVITLLRNHEILLRSGPRRVSPFMAPMMIPNAASAAVAIAYGLRGPNLALVSACATGSNAIGEAAEVIRRGHADVMICGGSEAMIAPLSLAGFINMGAVSTRNDEPERASRPFDADRDGFVLGEGAGVLALESLEHAHARRCRIYCELVGYGASSDAYHITAPEETGQGAALAMERALHDADLEPEEVDYINAHGTSTALNDRIETKAIRTVFGLHADHLVVSSSKSMLGQSIPPLTTKNLIPSVTWITCPIRRDSWSPESSSPTLSASGATMVA